MLPIQAQRPNKCTSVVCVRLAMAAEDERQEWINRGLLLCWVGGMSRPTRWKNTVVTSALRWARTVSSPWWRGFPGQSAAGLSRCASWAKTLRFLSVLNVLRRAGARVAVVYHDTGPYSGSRGLDKVRRAVQLRIMRTSLRRVDLGIFTVPVSAISWLSAPPRNAVFIPVGANLPVDAVNETETCKSPQHVLRVAVFGITGGAAGRKESARIADAIRFVSATIGKLELHAFGRHADHCESMLRESLRDAPVDVQVKGVLPPEEVVSELASADAMLFVRGAISTRRGSAIAGIACGLPVIAERGTETSGPIEEAGVVLVSADQPKELAEALLRVLTNPDYRAQLAESSRLARDKYFSWPAIATRYAEELRKTR